MFRPALIVASLWLATLRGYAQPASDTLDRIEKELAQETRLTLVERVALARQPALEEAKARTLAARERAAGAERLPDPQFKYEQWAVPIKRPYALDRADTLMFGLRQGLPAPGARAARGRVVEEEVQIATHQREALARDLLLRVRRAYFDYYAADRVVTYPIVSALLGAPHVTDVRGFSMFGMSFVYVIFEEGTDVYWARSRVLEYMNGIRSRLPSGVDPVIGPDATGIGWVFQYALVDKSGKHSLDELRTYQDFNLRYALGGPPMVRDEDGMLVGYVYVDIDQASRDIGGYVDDAKSVVYQAIQTGELTLPPGYSLRWTGQYELLQETTARMKIVVPLTLMIVVLLLFLHFKNLIEVLIVLLSIPFALVGSVWLLWLLDYRISTAVWVGIIALVGLAAQTGIVMIVYIDNAFERRKRAGKIRDLNDIIWAHMEGTVLRVRPKLMTVATMLIGLVPLLWASGSGADVMKRIAAPMVGGLITSAFLTLEIIPVVYTYWRQEQLLWELLSAHDMQRLGRLKLFASLHGAGWALLGSLGVAMIYVSIPSAWRTAGFAVSIVTVAGSALAYLSLRPAARRLVWPEQMSSPLP